MISSDRRYLLWVCRVNPYGLPIITSLFSKAYQTIEAKYYGYLNSDILIQPTVFEVLHYCMNQTEQGALAREVICEWIESVVAWTCWSCIWTEFQWYPNQFHFIQWPIRVFQELFSSSTSASEPRKCCLWLASSLIRRIISFSLVLLWRMSWKWNKWLLLEGCKSIITWWVVYGEMRVLEHRNL